MVFDINWAIFRIRVTFKGHMALTLVSLEKVLWIKCASQHEVTITYGSKVMAKDNL